MSGTFENAAEEEERDVLDEFSEQFKFYHLNLLLDSGFLMPLLFYAH